MHGLSMRLPTGQELRCLHGCRGRTSASAAPPGMHLGACCSGPLAHQLADPSAWPPLPCRSLLLLGFVVPTLYIWHTELRMRRAFLAARAPADGRRHVAAAVAALGPSLFDYLMFAGPAGGCALAAAAGGAALLCRSLCRSMCPWCSRCRHVWAATCPCLPTPHHACNVCCLLPAAVACMYSFVVVPS